MVIFGENEVNKFNTYLVITGGDMTSHLKCWIITINKPFKKLT